jgi:hypothetical protein
LIPIAYRRDFRRDRIHVLPGACSFFFAWADCVEPIAHAYVRMKDPDPYTNSAYTYTYSPTFSLSLCLSTVLLRRITQACRCQPYLSSCCTKAHTGAWACVRPCMQAGSKCARRPWWLFCQSCTRRTINPPTRQTTTLQNVPAIAQQRQDSDSDSASRLPGAVMVECLKTCSSPVLPHPAARAHHLSKRQQQRSRCQKC